jgi:hypothetical protein
MNGSSSTSKQWYITVALVRQPVGWLMGDQQRLYLSSESEFIHLLNGMKLTFFSQQFWGNMVAAAHAGPEPIHHRKLNAQNLADAISYCLTEEATHAAKSIANKMRADDGVKAAVRSFHANLPLENLQCEVNKNEVAAWRYKRGGKYINLSKTVTEVLLQHNEIDRKNLKL